MSKPTKQPDKETETVYELYSKTPISISHIASLIDDGAVILRQDPPDELGEKYKLTYYYPSFNPKKEKL